MSSSDPSYPTGLSARLAARSGALTSVTSGVAPTYLQANLLVLPSRYAADFRLLCARNPVPCPLLAESATPGSFANLTSHVYPPTGPHVPLPVAADIDLRRDAPRYRVYHDSQLVTLADGAQEPIDIAAQWTDDHVGFLVGCSYSFETALAAAGLAPRHQWQGRNVSMYRTNIPLCPAGVFTGGTYVVSMRPYRRREVEQVRDITRRFVTTHGEPVAWGWDGARRLGIADVGRPDWGDVPMEEDRKTVFRQGVGESTEGEDEWVPVFWGCGVTPQEAVMRAGLQGVVMGHAPGHMIVLDVTEDEVFP